MVAVHCGEVVVVFSALMKANTTFAQHMAQDFCAEVKIEILQELTMERQGFEAMMRIRNSLDTFTLDHLNITVNFEDDNGQPVIATSDTTARDAHFLFVLITRAILLRYSKVKMAALRMVPLHKIAKLKFVG